MSSDGSHEDLNTGQERVNFDTFNPNEEVKSQSLNDSSFYMKEALPRSPLVSPDDRMFSGSILHAIISYNEFHNKPVLSIASTQPQFSAVKEQETMTANYTNHTGGEFLPTHAKNKTQKSYASGPLKTRPSTQIRTSLSNMAFPPQQQQPFFTSTTNQSPEKQPMIPPPSSDEEASKSKRVVTKPDDDTVHIEKVSISFRAPDQIPLTEAKQVETLKTDIFYKFPNFETKNLHLPPSDENRKRPPRKSIFQKLVQTPRSQRSIVKCFESDGSSVEVRRKTLGLVEDKAFFQKDSLLFKKFHHHPDHSPPIPRLTRLLRKHAATGTLSRQETAGMLSLINIIQKRNMNIFQRLQSKIGKYFERLANHLSLIRTRPKHKIKPFRPDDPFRVFWDAFILIFIMYDLIMMPFELSFGMVESKPIEAVDTVVTIFFLVDIFVNFHTAHYLDGLLVFNQKEIVHAYLSGWFWVDLFASFPYHWMSDHIQDPSQSHTYSFNHIQARYLEGRTFLRLIKLIRFLRLFKLKRVVEKLHGAFDIHNPVVAGSLNLLKLCIVITFLAHWCACGWYFFVLGSEGENWLTKINLEGSALNNQYITSLYYTFTIMLTVGFGDITPDNKNEKIFAIFVMLLGGCVFGYVMNYIGIILYSLEDEKSKIRKKVSSLSRYMQKEGLAKDVQHDVKKYLEFLFESETKMKQTDKDLINMLSSDLKGRVYEQINGKLVYGNSVLMENFSKKLLYQVTGRIEERTYVPGQKVFEVSDTEGCIYFVSKGTIDFYLPKCHNVALSLNQGDHFGEVAFFTEMPRTLTAKSLNYSRLLILNRDKFVETLNDFPLDREVFCMIRDKILLYNDLSALKLKCSGCDEDNHVLEICPQIRFAPDRESAARKHLNKLKVFKKDFTRRNRIRFHARECLDDLVFEAENIAKNYHLELLEIQEINKVEEEEENREETDEEGSVQSDQVPVRGGKGKTGATYVKNIHIISSFLKKAQQKQQKRSKTIPDKDSSGVKNIWMALYNLHSEGLKALKKNLTEIGLETVTQELGAENPIQVNEVVDFEFDKVRNYEMYFYHNNISKIQDRINRKKRFLVQPSEEILNLRTHLKRFFITFEKQKNKTRKNSRGKSVFALLG